MSAYLRLISAIALTFVGILAHAQATNYVGDCVGSTEMLCKEKIIRKFGKKQSGVKVVFFAGNSTDVLTKLKAQEAPQDLSVALIDDGAMYRAVGEGLPEKFKTLTPPNYDVVNVKRADWTARWDRYVEG